METERKRNKLNLIETLMLYRINDFVEIESPSGGFEGGAASLMPVMDQLRVQLHRVVGIKPSVSGHDPTDPPHAVHLPQPHHQLSDHGVHPRAQPPARDDRRPDTSRFEIDGPAWTGAMVRLEWGRRRRRKVGGEVEGGVAEDDVGGRDVEAVGWVEELVALERVCVGLEVREIVREVGELFDADGALLIGGSGGHYFNYFARAREEEEQSGIIMETELLRWLVKRSTGGGGRRRRKLTDILLEQKLGRFWLKRLIYLVYLHWLLYILFNNFFPIQLFRPPIHL